MSAPTLVPVRDHTKLQNIGTNTHAEIDTGITKLAGIEALADVTDAVNIASSIVGVVDKPTPVDADSFGIIDSAAVNVLKELTWANVKATLKAYMDTLYNNYVHPNHSGDVTSVADGATTIAAGAVDVPMLSATGTPSATTYHRGDNTWATPAGAVANTEKICFPAEAAYLPITNPATLTEESGLTTYAGQSHADFDDTTAEHIVFRGPVIDYDGGNIVIVATAKAKTPPSAEVTLIFDIYTVGIASNGSYDRAVTVDTGIDLTFTLLFTELMPNLVDRDFSGASAWANVDINAYDETTDLTITATVAAQYCTCPVASVPTTIGKKYCLEFDVATIVETWTIKSFDGTQTLGTVTANGANQQIEWIATTTGGLRIVAVAATSSGDFDNFSLTESNKMYKATATVDPANVATGDKIVWELIRNVADTLVGDGEFIDMTTSHTRA